MPCEGRDGLAGLGDAQAMDLGLLGRGVDLRGAVADRDDEVRRCGIIRDLAGGLVLHCHRAVDVFEHRPDCLDRGGNPVHGLDGTCSVLLQHVDLLLDLLGGLLGLYRQRLHFGCNHSETAPGGARASRLDGGIQREQRGLLGDLRDQVDDIADRGGGFPEPVDIEAGLAHPRADALRRMGKFVGSLRERRRRGLRCAGASGQGIGALANGRQRRCGRLSAAVNRAGRALQLADQRPELEFQEFEYFPGRIAAGIAL